MDERLEHEAVQEDRMVEVANRWTDLDSHWVEVLEVIGD